MQKIVRLSVTPFAIGLVAVALAACASGAPDASVPPDADVTVVAENFGFDTDEIRLVAGEETLLFFLNRDPEAHNIAIYPDGDRGGEPLFRGDPVADGGAAYRIPPLEPGTYYFQCDPHPVMNGTVVVEERGS